MNKQDVVDVARTLRSYKALLPIRMEEEFHKGVLNLADRLEERYTVGFDRNMFMLLIYRREADGD